jgi:hypothetical protein
VETIPPDNSRVFVEPGPRSAVLGRLVRAGAWAGQFAPPQVWRKASKPLVRTLTVSGDVTRPKLAPEVRARLLPYFEEQGEGAVIASGLLVPHNRGFFPRYKYFQETVWARAHTAPYTNHFSTRLGAIRRDVFAETGGFDETITNAGVEDFEFGYRMRALTPSRLAPDVFFSHRHPLFAKQARLYFARTADYIELMHRMQLARGNVTTIGATNSEAATALLAFASQALLVSSLVVPAALLLSAGVAVAYLVRIRGLIGLMFASEGTLFAARGVLAHYVLSTAIVLGALQGKLRCLSQP